MHKLTIGDTERKVLTAVQDGGGDLCASDISTLLGYKSTTAVHQPIYWLASHGLIERSAPNGHGRRACKITAHGKAALTGGDVYSAFPDRAFRSWDRKKKTRRYRPLKIDTVTQTMPDVRPSQSNGTLLTDLTSVIADVRVKRDRYAQMLEHLEAIQKLI